MADEGTADMMKRRIVGSDRSPTQSGNKRRSEILDDRWLNSGNMDKTGKIGGGRAELER